MALGKDDVPSAHWCHCDVFSDVQDFKNYLHIAFPLYLVSEIYYNLSTHPDYFFPLSFTSLNQESSA